MVAEWLQVQAVGDGSLTNEDGIEQTRAAGRALEHVATADGMGTDATGRTNDECWLEPKLLRAGNRRFWRSKRPLPTSKSTGKGGGLRPPRFPMGFAVGWAAQTPKTNHFQPRTCTA